MQRLELEQFRESAPAGSSFTSASEGVWTGGRVYVDEFGDEVFLPLGTKRTDIGINRPLTFLGDGIKNLKGWGDRTAPVPLRPEVMLIVPVLPVWDLASSPEVLFGKCVAC